MERIHQTEAELKSQLGTQLRLLRDYAEKYDSGNQHYATEMAVKLRLLLKDTTRSSSLLGQLSLLNRPLYDTAAQVDLLRPGIAFMSGHSSLTCINSLNGLVPHLGGTIPGNDGLAPFNEYWNRVVLIDNSGLNFTRKDLIENVAEQDGGAHVDPGIDKDHYDLSRKNSIGIEFILDNNQFEAINRPDFPAIRQITYEILRTFNDCINW